MKGCAALLSVVGLSIILLFFISKDLRVYSCLSPNNCWEVGLENTPVLPHAKTVFPFLVAMMER